MKFIYLQKYFQATLILAVLVLMWGCGSGGGPTPNEVASNGASVAVIPSGDGVYVIQGNNMEGVAGMDLIISYDRSALSSPTVVQGGLISEALMMSNTTDPRYHQNRSYKCVSQDNVRKWSNSYHFFR